MLLWIRCSVLSQTSSYRSSLVVSPIKMTKNRLLPQEKPILLVLITNFRPLFIHVALDTTTEADLKIACSATTLHRSLAGRKDLALSIDMDTERYSV